MSFNLTTEELEVQRLAKDFTEREIEPLAAQIEKEHRTPREFLKKFADVGFMAMTVPRKYGGSDASILSHFLVLEEIAHAGIGIEWLVAMNNSIPETISRFGSEELKQKYLPPTSNGEKCAAILFTEPETGSDPRMIITTAKQDGDYYIVNGQKRFITWGAWDGYGTVYAQDETGRVSCFVMDKNVEGYTTDPPYEKMGLNALESVDVYFENVKVPKENFMGEKGKGFDILLWWIAGEKIQQSAGNMGMAEAALDESINYAKGRMLRSGPMSDLQGIQWTLAEMQTKIEASRWLTYKCANLMQEQAPDWIRLAALCKNFVIPTALDVCRLGTQIHGAYGYTKDFKVERLYRGAVGGLGIVVSLEINKSIIGLSLVK